MKRETIADLDFKRIVGAIRYTKENRETILAFLGCKDPKNEIVFPREEVLKVNSKRYFILFDRNGDINTIGLIYDDDSKVRLEEGQWIAKTIFDQFIVLDPIPEVKIEEGPFGLPKYTLPLTILKKTDTDISDGYNTFGELYRYLMLYNALFFNELAKQGVIKVGKSHKHCDGVEPFGGGWFIVQAELPTGQISKHYENKYWDLFRIPELETGWEWDGHSPNDAADRMEAYLKIKDTVVTDSHLKPIEEKEESNQPKGYNYVACIKFDRYGGMNLFNMLGFEDVSLTEDTENDHAIITPVPSDRAFGLKLKTPEGLVEVNNGDFVFKDNEGNFSISQYPPITFVNTDNKLCIIKAMDENPMANPCQSTSDNLVESNKDSIYIGDDKHKLPCEFKMSKEEWKEAEEAAKNILGGKYNGWKKVNIKESSFYSFSTVLYWIKKGMVVTRSSWTNKVVFRQVPAVIGADIVPKMQSLPVGAKTVILRTGGIAYESQCLIYNTSTGVADSWCPTIEDIMAEDWKLYETEEKEEK